MSGSMRQLKMQWLGKCPCGCDIYASATDFAVAHDLPYCKQFEEMEPDEFLTFVRKSRGIDIGQT